MISPTFLPVPLREIANTFLKTAEAQILEYLTVELVETPWEEPHSMERLE